MKLGKELFYQEVSHLVDFKNDKILFTNKIQQYFHEIIS